MQAFSETQRRLLDAPDDQVKMAIELDDDTPVRKCTGADPIQIGGEWYDPDLGPKSFDKIALTNPKTVRTKIMFDDLLHSMRDQWYTTQFDCDAQVFWYLRDADNSWNLVLTIAWSVQKCTFDRKGHFFVILSAAAGSRPRSGGTIGSRSECPEAPEPGEVWRIGIGGSGITFRPGVGTPPPPPGGHQAAYDPGGRSSTADGGSIPEIPRPPGGDGGSVPDPSGSGSSSS
jgi:hypothetical protein